MKVEDCTKQLNFLIKKFQTPKGNRIIELLMEHRDNEIEISEGFRSGQPPMIKLNIQGTVGFNPNPESKLTINEGVTSSSYKAKDQFDVLCQLKTFDLVRFKQQPDKWKVIVIDNGIQYFNYNDGGFSAVPLDSNNNGAIIMEVKRSTSLAAVMIYFRAGKPVEEVSSFKTMWKSEELSKELELRKERAELIRTLRALEDELKRHIKRSIVRN